MGDHQDPAYQAGYQQAIGDALSVAEVSALIGITTKHLAHLSATIALPCARKVGDKRIYWPADVEALRHRERGPSRWDRDRE